MSAIGYMSFPNPHTVFPGGVWMPHSEAEAREFARRIIEPLNEMRETIERGALQLEKDQIYMNGGSLAGLRLYLYESPWWSLVHGLVWPVWDRLYESFAVPSTDLAQHMGRYGAIYQEGPPVIYLDRIGGMNVQMPAAEVDPAAYSPANSAWTGGKLADAEEIAQYLPQYVAPPTPTGTVVQTGGRSGKDAEAKKGPFDLEWWQIGLAAGGLFLIWNFSK